MLHKIIEVFFVYDVSLFSIMLLSTCSHRAKSKTQDMYIAFTTKTRWCGWSVSLHALSYADIPEVPKAKLCPYFGVKTKVCPSHASHANPLPGWIKHNIWQIKSASWDRAKVSPWMGIRMLLSNAPGAWNCLSWGRQHICSWVWFPNVSSFITIRYDKQPRYWSTRLLLFMVFVIWLQYQRCWSNGYVRYSNYEALGHGRITSQCAHGFQSVVPGCCPWSGRCRSFLAGI